MLHGLVSFELEPPGEPELARRRQAFLEGGHPYLVPEDAASGLLLGYAYAGPYRTRPAYRFAVRASIYLEPGAAGRGIGAKLLAALIVRCEAAGFRLMVAVIGNAANAPSIGLHARFGFSQTRLLRAVGLKHGRSVDSVLMTRPLGQGDATPPIERR